MRAHKQRELIWLAVFFDQLCHVTPHCHVHCHTEIICRWNLYQRHTCWEHSVRLWKPGKPVLNLEQETHLFHDLFTDSHIQASFSDRIFPLSCSVADVWFVGGLV